MDLLTEFKTYLVTEKGASANTVASYMRDITQYVHYLGEDDRQVLGATSECIEAYRKQLLKMGKSAATVTRALASLKCLYRWLQQKGRCPENPAKGVKAEKVERKLPQILSNQEVELLLEQPRCVDDKGFRDHAMLEVLYATGIRVSELISLNLDDVNLTSGYLVCMGKKKSRIIPLYPGAIRALSDYLKNIRPHLVAPGERALFVNMNGVRMSRQGFLEAGKILSGEGWHPDRDHPPHPASFLCRPPAAKWRRSTLHPGDDGARGHLVHPDLHQTHQSAPDGRVPEGAPQSVTRRTP